MKDAPTECVGDAAVMLEALNGTVNGPEDVDVGGLCGQDRGERGSTPWCG